MTILHVNGVTHAHPRPFRAEYPGGITVLTYTTMNFGGELLPAATIILKGPQRRYRVTCPDPDDDGPGLRVRDGDGTDRTGEVPVRIAHAPSRVVAWLVGTLDRTVAAKEGLEA